MQAEIFTGDAKIFDGLFGIAPFADRMIHPAFGLGIGGLEAAAERGAGGENRNGFESGTASGFHSGCYFKARRTGKCTGNK